MASPRQGEVWLVDVGMAAKVRPAVPHTTSPRQSRFEASASVPFLRPRVFDAQNLITIPHAKLIRSLGVLGSSRLATVERAVRLWLGIQATTPET